MIYFTSDHHFNHSNIIKYCDRPFWDVGAMNRVLIELWNKTVTSDDDVYYLGDFGFGPPQELEAILKQLNHKKIILVKGNHDKAVSTMLNIGFDEVHKYIDLEYEDKKVFLSHVPMVGNFHDFYLCGHCHDKFKMNGKLYNVGVDVNDFRPISIDDIYVKYWKQADSKLFVPMTIDIQGEG